MKSIAVLLSLLFSTAISAQVIYTPDYIHPTDLNENFKEVIFSDSLASSFFLILVKDVPMHKHLEHTEHIYVLGGTADMIIGEDLISIAEHDILVIPKNTAHSVNITSRDPLKVISIQSPKFTGKDRIWLD